MLGGGGGLAPLARGAREAGPKSLQKGVHDLGPGGDDGSDPEEEGVPLDLGHEVVEHVSNGGGPREGRTLRNANDGRCRRCGGDAWAGRVPASSAVRLDDPPPLDLYGCYYEEEDGAGCVVGVSVVDAAARIRDGCDRSPGTSPCGIPTFGVQRDCAPREILNDCGFGGRTRGTWPKDGQCSLLVRQGLDYCQVDPDMTTTTSQDVVVDCLLEEETSDTVEEEDPFCDDSLKERRLH